MTYANSWEDAFLRYAPEASEGCWHWRGNVRGGYGRISFKGRLTYAHRYAYERVHGLIPDGMTVDHTCHNADVTCAGGPTCMHRSCVNPAHLEVVTAETNASRASCVTRTGRCGKGHYVGGANVYMIRGLPNCRSCHLDRQRNYENNKDHKDDIRQGGDGIVWPGCKEAN